MFVMNYAGGEDYDVFKLPGAPRAPKRSSGWINDKRGLQNSVRGACISIQGVYQMRMNECAFQQGGGSSRMSQE